jgi:kinase suppressor of Ras 2
VGACLKPPKLAIVMSVCRGTTLYKYLHIDTSTNTAKQNFDWIIHVAIQIAQGMGYLHTKGLLHKDLKSKNIFIDGKKAVISDFGLFSVSKLCKKSKLAILFDSLLSGRLLYRNRN